MSDRGSPADYGYAPRGPGHNAQSRVEFYQRDDPGGTVKMDYYPTTGTVKTSMDHPTQGKTQMFRQDLTPAQHTSVMENPRAHTGQGYQTKKK